MQGSQPQFLYTPEQRARRDATRWTLVQGVLAPVQFLVFLVSLYLVLNSLRTGEHTDWALASVVVKTLVLYLIMVTGCIWEKVVYGKYLFASLCRFNKRFHDWGVARSSIQSLFNCENARISCSRFNKSHN